MIVNSATCGPSSTHGFLWESTSLDISEKMLVILIADTSL